MPATGARSRWFALLAAILAPSFLFAQSFTSSITGKVADPSGGAVANAKVELKNVATNDVHQTTAEADGGYQFNNLLPGTYQITVSSPGFQTFVRENLVLQAQTAATVNATLTLGDVQQKVEVTDSQVLVDTETANTTITMNSQLLAALPNGTRNPLNFVFNVAGTTPAPGGQSAPFGSLDQMSSNFGMNGGRTGDEEVLIDGAPSQALDWGGLMVSPLQDSVQEQQIVQNTYDAQYERAGGGIVSLVTKGGSNQFHGEAYDFLQNAYFNANGWINNRNGAPRGPFKQNQFGGNISGPIAKRWNLFFFGGYEGLRQPNTQNSGLLTVPTAAERNGDFSQQLNSQGGPDLIYNPFTNTNVPNSNPNINGGFSYLTRQPFANNVIPSSLINPVGQKIIDLYPLPNHPAGPNGINNYFAQGSGNTTNDKSDVRVDWEQNSVHRMFVRWSDRYRQDILVPCFFCNGADTGVNQYNNGFQVVFDDTVTPSPTLVINSYLSASRWKEQHLAQGYGQASAQTIGLSNQYFQAPVLPTIGTDNGLASLGSGTYAKYIRDSDNFQMNFTKQFSKHTLKFGGNIDRFELNIVNESVGNFSFGSSLTSCDPQPGAPCQALNYSSGLTGNAFASMLLGTANGGGSSTNIDPAMAMHIYGVYIQDQWRVTPRLTVNAGLRYENQRPVTERDDRLMYFNPSAVNPISAAVQGALGHPVYGEVEYAGIDNHDRYQWKPDNFNFAPRVGIAYKVTDRLVARMGAGLFYLPTSALIGYDDEFEGYSAFTPYIPTSDGGYTPLNLVSNPFPTGINQPTGQGQYGLTQVGNGLNQVWPYGKHPTPYSEQWSFDLQYQLTPRSILGVGYNGNAGKKLLYGNPNINADQLPDQYLSLGVGALNQQVPNPFYGKIGTGSYLDTQATVPYNQLLRPFPEFTNINWTRSLPGARSSFNALNARYNLQFGNGASVLVTYQWSKALDNGPEDNFGWATGNSWRDSYNTRLDYSISSHDVPQSFATALVYDLPYGHGKRWGSSAPMPVRAVLGNWQVSSSIRLASGLPINGPIAWDYSSPLNDFGYPAGSETIANLIGNPVPSHQGPDHWFNPAAFADPPNPLTLGNAPTRITELRERALRNVDVSVSKNFGTERFKAVLRGEAFNLFNYAQYNSPDTCVTCSATVSSIGQITSYGTFGQMFGMENYPRQLQLSLKLSF